MGDSTLLGDVSMSFIIGAYASAPSLFSNDQIQEEIFYELLKERLKSIKGLEIPFNGENIHNFGNDFLIRLLEDEWSNVITAVPASFMNLKTNKHFGLASDNKDGRDLALSCHEKLNDIVKEINDKKGKSCISHIQLCSSPSFPLKDVSSSENSLLSSLEKITTWDWDGASLVLEHCDSQSVDGSYQKGFMSIEAELRIVDYLQESGLGMVLNWGRSVLEGRSPSTILDHIDLCQQKGCLKGFIFSGTSKNDPSYGSWEDQHMPFFREASKIKGLENSLLNEENANLTLDRLNKEALSYIGFKLQLLPQEEVSVEDRVEINFDAQEILQNKY